MKKIIPILVIACVFTALSHAGAAINGVTATYSGADSGSVNWSSSANWTPATVPNDTSTIGYVTTVGHSGSSALTVNVDVATTVSRLILSNTSSGGGASVLTLKLGANLIVQNEAINTGVTSTNSGVVNSSGVASNVVLDLNGFNYSSGTFNTSDGFATGSVPYSISNSSSTASKFTAPVWQPTGTVAVGNNVTLALTDISAGGANIQTTQWATGATFQIDTNVLETTNVNGGAATSNLYNLTIGNTANNNFSDFRPSNAGVLAVRVNGDFLINHALNGNANHIQLGWSGGTAVNNLYVAGNFTDQGGTGATSYNTNVTNNKTALMVFNGGSTERDVSINRDVQSSLATGGGTTNLKIGESSSVSGNVRLTHDLTDTAGSLTMLKESRLNVQNFTVTAGSLVFTDNSVGQHPTFAYTFGTSDAGLISTTGTIGINTFNLQLIYDGTGWINGSSLTLFQYTGALSGTPALGAVTATGITYGGIVWDASNGTLRLTNVNVIPEPSAALLIGAFGGLVVWTARRKMRRRSSAV